MVVLFPSFFWPYWFVLPLPLDFWTLEVKRKWWGSEMHSSLFIWFHAKVHFNLKTGLCLFRIHNIHRHEIGRTSRQYFNSLVLLSDSRWLQSMGCRHRSIDRDRTWGQDTEKERKVLNAGPEFCWLTDWLVFLSGVYRIYLKCLFPTGHKWWWETDGDTRDKVSILQWGTKLS